MEHDVPGFPGIMTQDRPLMRAGNRDVNSRGRSLSSPLLFLLLLSCAHQPFTTLEGNVTFSTSENWGVIPSASGAFSASGKKLTFVLEHVSLLANSVSPGAQHVNSFRVGVASATADGNWDVSQWSREFPVNRDIASGETLELAQLSGEISLSQIPSLHGSWLALEVEVDFHGMGAKTFAHSSRQIFAIRDIEQRR